MKQTAHIFFALLLITMGLGAQSAPSLAERIDKIIQQPAYRHSTFGIEFYSLDTGKPIYALNADKLFVPGSTAKLLTEGTALELLGGDYRFHTRVYHTGRILPDGTLEGDLVLVASGDPNLSGRIRPDGTLAFENVDHSYAGFEDARAVPGDPLAVIRELAQQIASHHITKIKGNVVVDVSLFPEGAPEGGTGVILSPIAVNDNVIDVTVAPGQKEGAPAVLQVSPETAYAVFINRVVTGKADSRPDLRWESDQMSANGSHSVGLVGSVPEGKPATLTVYKVPKPSRFAEFVLIEALKKAGVAVETNVAEGTRDWKNLAAAYTPENLVGEHVSPPLKEDVKVTLKVSQNLHASMTPYLLGAILAHHHDDADEAGFDLEHQFLEKAGLDLSGAAQSDGAGGKAFFSPDFMVHYIAFMAQQKDYATFHDALPILGRDGTLHNIQVNSPAAGHVHAKTGTFADYNALNRNLMLVGKGLAGYMTTSAGQHLAFAIYVNQVPVSLDLKTLEAVGNTLGQIAAAAYEASPGPRN